MDLRDEDIFYQCGDSRIVTNSHFYLVVWTLLSITINGDGSNPERLWNFT